MAGYELRSPTTETEWAEYHAIRRRVLFEARGRGDYDEHHPDERRPGHHPLLLLHEGMAVGVIRVDLEPPRALLRRVAVREDVQRAGHGRALLSLAEGFARRAGCTAARSSVAADAVGFYERCGYRREAESAPAADSGATVTMVKELVV